ncbi:MAG: hypothetical protein PHU06_09395 [Gallionella sp.]|nr:hypothetical protein [Gallionella sp.]MDD4959576.1 hypothetical protein [Gallionella sp.]
MNETTKIQSRKLRKVLCCALGLMGVVSGGDAQCYDARPDSMVPYVQVASVTASKIAQAGNPKPIEFEDDCREVGNAEDYVDSAYNQFGIGGILSSLGYRIDSATGNYILPEQVRAGFKSTIISSPVHGEVFQTEEGKKHFYFSYRANEGYVGKDSFVIGVDTLTRSGKPIQFMIKFKLSVVEQITNENEKSTCVGMKFNSAPVAPPTIVAQATTNKINMTLSACEGVKTPDDPQGQLGGQLTPAGWYQTYMENKYGKYFPIDGAKVTLLVGPTHGKIENFGYIPNHGFLGQDKVIHLVELDGKRIKVITTLYVDNHGLHCEGDAGDVKRISSTNTLDLTTGLAALLTDTQLSGQFANSGITLNFTDLPSQAACTMRKLIKPFNFNMMCNLRCAQLTLPLSKFDHLT